MSQKALRILARNVIRNFDIPGLAIAVVYKGNTLLCEGIGFREISQRHAVNEHTLFGIGSLTKGFVATALMQQIQQNKLNVDEKLHQLLPQLIWHSPRVASQVTVRHLLTHTTGFPAYPSNLLAYFGFAEQDIANKMFAVSPIADTPGTVFQYHNGVYLLAGMLLEQLSGMPWSNYLAKNIFAPLSLADARAYKHNVSTNLSANVALPYIATKTGHRVPQFLDFADHLGAAGAIHASINDMQQWLRFNLADLSLPDIDPTILQSIHQQHIKLPPAATANALDRAITIHGYGLGWYKFRYGDLVGSYHTGNVPGYTSLAALIPTEDIGLVVLCNQSLQKRALQALMLAVFDSVLTPQIKSTSWLDIALSIERQLLPATSFNDISPIPVPSNLAKAITGTYRNNLFGEVTINSSAKGLSFFAGPEKREFPVLCIDPKSAEFAFDMNDSREFLFFPSRLGIAPNGKELILWPRIDDRNGSIISQKPVFFTPS